MTIAAIIKNEDKDIILGEQLYLQPLLSCIANQYKSQLEQPNHQTLAVTYIGCYQRETY